MLLGIAVSSCRLSLTGYYLARGGATVSPLFFIHERAWGIIWLAVAAILLTGVLAREDRWQFTVAVLLKTAWAMEWFRLSWLGIPYQWTRGCYFLAMALIVLLIASWPEYRR